MWFRKAADQGHDVAQNKLGDMYAEGLGVTKDARVAMSWYEKAGAQGNADAQHSIGRLINQGVK